MRRLAGLFAVAGLAASTALGSNVQLLSSLPDEAFSEAVQLDASGNIYVAGYLMPQTPKSSSDASDAFVAKLSPDGLQLLYLTIFGGSGIDIASQLALGGDGSVFVVGSTESSDFAVTAGALQPAPGTGGGFVAKLNPAGSVIYSGMLGAPARNVVLDPGQGPPQLPAGGFQSTQEGQWCYQAYGDPSGPLLIACNYQCVAEIDPAGDLLWATYVTGTYGAVPGAIALDSENNVIVAGTTNSTDYPVTAGALQAAYPPNGSALPNGVTTTSGNGYSGSWAPSATGYITRLNSTGSALVWSTYFGGSYSDNLTGMAIDANGEIYVSGLAASSDLPGLSAVPSGCQPSQSQAFGFLARIPAEGSQTVAVQLVCGAPVSCLNAPNSSSPSSCGGFYGWACMYPGVVFPGGFFNSVPVAQSLDNYCGGVLTGLAQGDWAAYSGWPTALRPDGRAVVAGANGAVAAVDFLKLPPVGLRHGPVR
ncbi:MAG TPA: SBBP repeat-containing protein [Bryobacteraceae bacterium]